jgi:colanic acid biosynthesis glycosyl transferase WcaI
MRLLDWRAARRSEIALALQAWRPARVGSLSSFAVLMTGAGAKSGGLRHAGEAERLGCFLFQDYQPPELLSDSLAAADVHLVSLPPALEGLMVPSKIYGIPAAGRPTTFIGATDGDLARIIRYHDCGLAVPVGDSERGGRRL